METLIKAFFRERIQDCGALIFQDYRLGLAMDSMHVRLMDN